MSWEDRERSDMNMAGGFDGIMELTMFCFHDVLKDSTPAF